MPVLTPGAVAVVTGAGSGIGRATSHALAARHLTVACADIDGAAAERTCAAIGGRGGKATAYRVDVGDLAAMEAFAAKVRDELGAPAVVVNNAGIGIGGSFLSHTAEDWRRVVDVNLLGVVHGGRLFGQQMVDAGGAGHIVNIASAAAFTPLRSLPAYGATKAAVLMLSESMRADLRKHRIGVSVICPGFIATGIYRKATFTGIDSAEEAERQRYAQAVLGRWSTSPVVVAKAIIRAIERDKAVVPVTAGAHLTYALAHLAPGLLRQTARLGDDAALARLRPLARFLSR